jgi:acetyl esterase/lipase
MYEHRVANWDSAYANGVNIVGGDSFPARWAELAEAYRAGLAAMGRAELDVPYGEGARQVFDLIMPASEPMGLVLFVHGGYWLAFDKSSWSHLARGCVDSGYAVAIPSYTLCPANSVSEITREIAACLDVAARRIEGDIRLTGHSAGGHLVTRLLCRDVALAPDIRRRVARAVSISGVHDLRPLLKTSMKDRLRLDAAEAAAESPALLEPVPDARLVCWVGGAERAEFLRQSELLANIWVGLGATTSLVIEPDRHHFNVIDGLTDPLHPLTRALLA